MPHVSVSLFKSDQYSRFTECSQTSCLNSAFESHRNVCRRVLLAPRVSNFAGVSTQTVARPLYRWRRRGRSAYGTFFLILLMSEVIQAVILQLSNDARQFNPAIAHAGLLTVQKDSPASLLTFSTQRCDWRWNDAFFMRR